MQRENCSLPRIRLLLAEQTREIVFILILGVLGAGAGLFAPFLAKSIIDEGLPKQDLVLTFKFACYAIIAIAISSMLSVVTSSLATQVANRTTLNLRARLFSHVMNLSLRFFSTTEPGEIQTRIILDTNLIGTALQTGLAGAVVNLPLVIGYLIAMIVMSWKLTLVAVGFIPFVILVSNVVIKKIAHTSGDIQTQSGFISSMAEEHLSMAGALLNKTNNCSMIITDKFCGENQKLMNLTLKSSILHASFFAGVMPMIIQIPPLIISCVVIVCNKFETGNFSVGLLIAFTTMQAHVYHLITSLLDIQHQLSKSLNSFVRIFEYLDLTPEIQDSPNAQPINEKQVKGQVCFDHVWFRYNKDSWSWTLGEINLVAEPGQLVALVGPSGAGKSTLTHLISRLYDVDIGSVCLDGIDIKNLPLDQIRSLVSVVSQESYFINDTILENLRLANPAVTEEQCIHACEAAFLHEHITKLPLGYRTVLGSRGYKLSGGERQRLSIARALLRDPKILILDEATSALDSEFEKKIQESLANLRKGRTTFAIAHRLSTIQSADLIVVIEDGRIVEKGTHVKLVKAGRRYADLERAQRSNHTTSEFLRI